MSSTCLHSTEWNVNCSNVGNLLGKKMLLFKSKLFSSVKDSILELVDFPTDAKKIIESIRHDLVFFAVDFWGDWSFRDAESDCRPNTICVLWVVLDLIFDEFTLRCSDWLPDLVFKVFIGRPDMWIISSASCFAPDIPRFHKFMYLLRYAEMWFSTDFNWSDQSVVIENFIE